MKFSEQVLEDIDDVFLNIDEFAETAVINSKAINCVRDDDRLVNRTDAAAIGTAIGERLIFVKASDLSGKPMPGSRVEYDDKTWFVRNVIDNMGMYEIRLGVTKT